MGKGWEGIEVSTSRSEGNWLGTRKAHHVFGSPLEDCGCSKSAMGASEESEVGWLEAQHGKRVPLLRVFYSPVSRNARCGTVKAPGRRDTASS
jgi:hypothetical protein